MKFIFIIACLTNLVIVLAWPASVSIDSTEKEHAQYLVQVGTAEKQISLNLRRPDDGIFHSNFKFQLETIDENGNLVFNDVTPSREHISSLENQIFVDTEKNAAVKLVHHNDGIRMHGEINNQIITHNVKGEHDITELNTNSKNIDYLTVPGDKPLVYAKPFNPSIQTIATPEVLIIGDYQTYLQFNGSIPALTEYFAIFMRGVNNRYATIDDPNITFKIVGLVMLTSKANQPFIEQNQNSDGTYSIQGVLESFSQHMFTSSSSYTPHDTAALISGLNFGSVAGYAWIGGACREINNNKSVKTSVSNDNGGVFDGIWTVAHELAHNLGSPHDGDGASASCPWADGYIMSYEGTGTENKFYFSSCSKLTMKTYIESTNAACLTTNEAPSSWAPSQLQPGDKLNMDSFCQRVLDREDAIVSPKFSADDLCKNVRCQWKAPCPSPNESSTCTWTSTRNRPAPDGASCGTSGKKCLNGWCNGT